MYEVTKLHGLRAYTFAVVSGANARAGSVFTTVYRERSVYGILDRFMLVNGKQFAAVSWLSQPVYPYAPFTVVVRVHMMVDQPLNRCVIPCDRIEPCGVLRHAGRRRHPFLHDV